ncbi:type IV pilus secretin PilQ [Desulfoplanes sp.]
MISVEYMRRHRGAGAILLWGMVVLGILFVVVGCRGNKEIRDPFFEKWQKLARESKGYSPQLTQESVDIDRSSSMQEIAPDAQKKVVHKPLPTMPTTLDVHDTEIRAVLQALARAAKQNILINSNIKGLVTVRFLKTPWAEAFNALLKSNGLTYTWEGDIIRVVSIEDMKQQLAIEEVKAKIEAQDVAIKKMEPLKTRIIKVKYADIEQLRTSLLSVIGGGTADDPTLERGGDTGLGASEKGNIFADKHTNSLIIMARPDDMDMLTSVVTALDRPTKQVFLKAYIVETTKQTGRDLGMQWGGQWSNKLSGSSDRAYFGNPVGDDDGTGTNLFGTGNSGTGFSSNFPISQIVSPGMGTAGLGLNFMLGEIGGDILEAQLTALQTKGKANILSSPSLTTMDNQMAFTENGAKVPYVSYDDGDKTVEFEDAVLRLEMTPHVIDNTYLKMKILVKKDEVDFSDQLKVDGNPTILKKETNTNLIVRNNETIVISGLSKQTLNDSTSGVPGLSDIPGLGWLFKGNSKTDKMEEILIFVTPTILRTPTTAPPRTATDFSAPQTPEGAQP